jgi:anti-sigma regulatory factor (Ser/Thr protein kinase)
LLCVGLDPEPARFPSPFDGAPDAIERFCRAIVDATADLVCAFKPQIAHFAAQRAEPQLEAVCHYIRDTYPDVVLILDELLVNALIHGAGEITLLLAFDQVTGVLRGEVTDEDPGSPVVLEPGIHRQDGRGMLLVKHLAETWGWQDTAEGKTVWFTFRTES